jgi:hypothetical protein
MPFPLKLAGHRLSVTGQPHRRFDEVLTPEALAFVVECDMGRS